MYTRNTPPCSYCEAAKTLLNVKNIDYEVVVVGEDITKKELLELHPNVKTFPVVLNNEVFMGGFTELKQHVYSQEIGE